MAPDHRERRQQNDDCPENQLVAPSGTLLMNNDHGSLSPFLTCQLSRQNMAGIR
jgi:hypothetical protein